MPTRIVKSIPYLVCVGVSFAFTMLHAGPLNGTFPALVLAIAGHLYLPGLLVARFAGKLNPHHHPVTRLIWVFGGGLAVMVVIAALMRFVNASLTLYFVVLHGAMLILALLPPAQPAHSADQSWRFSRANGLFYVTLLFACLMAGVFGYAQGRFRTIADDASLFIGQTNWFIAQPGVAVNFRYDLVGARAPIRSQIEGWTFAQAGWLFASGNSGVDLIWHDMGVLFAWWVPLIFFAMGYELTGRESLGTLAALCAVLFGMLTIDNLTFWGTEASFGQYALFELNTLRRISSALVLPLAVTLTLIGMRTLLKRLIWRDWLIVGVLCLSMTIMHFRQTGLYLMMIVPAFLLHVLAEKRYRLLLKLAGVGIVGALGLAIALKVYGLVSFSGLTGANPLVNRILTEGTYLTVNYQRIQVPLLGQTFILDGLMIFYHPFVTIAVILALVAGFFWRRSLIARFVFASTMTVLLISFTPGVLEFGTRLTGMISRFLNGFPLAIPVALILAYGLDSALNVLAARARNIFGGKSRLSLHQGAALVIVAVMLLLLLDPSPLPISARTQFNALNERRATTQIRPDQENAVKALARLLPADRISNVFAYEHLAALTLEETANTIIVFWRADTEPVSHLYHMRFFGDAATWIDVEDTAWLRRAHVTHILMEANNTHLSQLVLRPDRFRLRYNAAGYLIFEVQESLVPSAADKVFARMNALMPSLTPPRWSGGDFALVRAGHSAQWQPIIADWQALFAKAPQADDAWYGLAMSYLLAGLDAQALPIWTALHERWPNLPQITDALAYTLQNRGDIQSASRLLLGNLDSANSTAQLFAARTLLTETFSYVLDNAHLDKVIGLLNNPLNLAPDQYMLRRQATIFMARGRWAEAADGLDRILPVDRGARDYAAQAMALVAQGRTSDALQLLAPASNAEWLRPKQASHPDRWLTNEAAQLKFLLEGAIARQERRYGDAEAAYQQAVNWGSSWAGRYFLAGVYRAQGQNARADQLLATLETEWQAAYQTPLPVLEPLLNAAQYRALFAANPILKRNGAENRLEVSAAYAAPYIQSYPITQWRFYLVDLATGSPYQTLDTPPVLVEGAFVRAGTLLTLPTNVAPLTQTRLYIEPRYNNALTYGTISADVVLNRPEAATPDPALIAAQVQFGTELALLGYTSRIEGDQLLITFYWRANTVPGDNYQVFVHILDKDGETVVQRDIAPLDGRYPTSQWRVDTLIADPHRVRLLKNNQPLPAGTYTVQVGMYRLSDLERLPLAESAPNKGSLSLKDNTVLLMTFTR